MKKLLLGIILGFSLHVSMGAFFSYRWWSAELECRDTDTNLQRGADCMNEKTQGLTNYIGFAGGHITYQWQRWGWRY